jgi:hypothetical protein
MAKSQFYTNIDIRYLVNKDIAEYDIRSAGLCALRHLGVIDEETCSYWKTRPKRWSVRHVGLHFSAHMQRMNEVITEVVDRFIEANKISDTSVISRKRDAVFIFGLRPKILKFDGFEFVRKHEYTSYMNLNGLELYLNGNKGALDVKGIDTRFFSTHPLKNTVKKFLQMHENLDRGLITYGDVYKFTHDIRNKYVRMELPSAYYRELTHDNPYTIIDCHTNQTYSIQTLENLDMSRCRIVCAYNFTKFIKPFINLLAVAYNKSSGKTRGKTRNKP